MQELGVDRRQGDALLHLLELLEHAGEVSGLELGDTAAVVGFEPLGLLEPFGQHRLDLRIRRRCIEVREVPADVFGARRSRRLCHR